MASLNIFQRGHSGYEFVSFIYLRYGKADTAFDNVKELKKLMVAGNKRCGDFC